jgi:hypothetical protein
MMQNYGNMFSRLAQAGGQQQPMGRPFGRPMGMNPQQWRPQVQQALQGLPQQAQPYVQQAQQALQGLPQQMQGYAQQALSGQMPQMPWGQQNRATPGPQVAGPDMGWPFRR